MSIKPVYTKGQTVFLEVEMNSLTHYVPVKIAAVGNNGSYRIEFENDAAPSTMAVSINLYSAAELAKKYS